MTTTNSSDLCLTCGDSRKSHDPKWGCGVIYDCWDKRTGQFGGERCPCETFRESSEEAPNGRCQTCDEALTIAEQPDGYHIGGCPNA